MDPQASAIWLLVCYGLAIICASVLGGWLPRWFRISHTRLQILISFVGGLMIGIAIFHMLPHSLHGMGADKINNICWAIMFGMLLMFFLLRFFHFHQHTVDEELDHESPHHQDHDHAGHDHDCGHHAHGYHAHPLNSISWIGMLLGLGIHTLLDGVALASTIQVEVGHAHGAIGLAGFGVFLAVLLHKPLDAMSLASLMRAQGASSTKTTLVNFGFACLVPLGALTVVVFGSQTTEFGRSVAGLGLAFSAGVFLCIALSDLLPEMEFHSHHRLPLSVALLTGVAVAWGIGFLEPAHLHEVHSEGQHHDHAHGSHNDHDHSHALPKVGRETFAGRLVARQRDGKTELEWNESISREDFRQIATLKNLESLKLTATNIRDEESDVLASLKQLKKLHLEKSNVSDQLAQAIGSLEKLESINLPNSRITNSGIESWAKLPNLILLRIGSPNLTDESLKTIRQMKSLRFLHLINVPITDAGLPHLSGMDHLESLYLDGDEATEEGLSKLLHELPKLHFHRDQQHLPNDPLDDKHGSSSTK
jgi:zinc and cadmium transporter